MMGQLLLSPGSLGNKILLTGLGFAVVVVVVDGGGVVVVVFSWIVTLALFSSSPRTFLATHVYDPLSSEDTWDTVSTDLDLK